MELVSQIVLTREPEKIKEEFARRCTEEGVGFLPFIKEGNFLVQDAALAIEKAYLASEERQLILLGADHFSEIVQNKLLKVIEEPPPKKEFVLLFRSKAEILPTIRSRLPIVHRIERVEEEMPDLDLATLDIRSVYDFVQKEGRLDAARAKEIIERLVKAAIASTEYDFDERSLDLFRDSIRALDVGSPPAFVLTGVLLKLLAKKKKPRRMR